MLALLLPGCPCRSPGAGSARQMLCVGLRIPGKAKRGLGPCAATAPCAKWSLCHHVTAEASRQRSGEERAPQLPSPPSDLWTVCGLKEADSKLIYFNWHCHFLGGKSGERQAHISCSPADFSGPSQELHHSSSGWKSC